MRSANDTPWSTSSPSIWGNIGVWVASSSRRNTLPGAMILTGGGPASIVRICTGRRVRAQDAAALDEEGVLHVARGVVGRRVQRVEVVPLGLDPRTGADLEAEAQEDVLDLAAHQRQRVQRPQRPAARRQRHVDGARQVFAQALLVEPGQPLGDRLLDLGLGAVGRLADGRALPRGDAPELLHELGDLALLAQVARLRQPDVFFAGGAGHLGDKPGL